MPMEADPHAVDASEAGRALAALRWSPEARLRDAVSTVASRSADLDNAQRAALRAAIEQEATG